MTSDRLSRRDFSWAAVAAGASSLGAPGLAATPAAAKPNILFITMDELTPDVLSSPAAAHIKTPHLDALAARGALFSHTYCQGPLCQPSRASLITGAYVKQTGQSWNGFDMDPSWPTLMKSLQAAGYTTAMVGKTHFSGAMKGARANASGAIDLATITPWCQKFGLDYLLEEFDHTVHRNPRIVSPYLSWLSGKNLVDRYRAEIRTAATSSPSDPYWEGHVSSMADADQLSTYLGDRTVDWLNHYDKQKPFFMWLSFIAPHPPITAAASWYDLYKDADLPTGPRALPDMPDNAWGRYLRVWTKETMSSEMTDGDALQMARHYYALVSEADDKIGAVLKALDDRGLSQNTWIIFSADHGDMLGHHNLVFKNVFYRGSVQVPNIIVPPGGMKARTVTAPVQSIDLTATMVELGGASLPTCKGRSLTPFLSGGGDPHAVVYSELAGHRNKDNYFVMAATDRYRYTYDKQNKLACELFDLKNDPGEMHNLVADPHYASLRDDLHKDYVETFLES